MKRILVFAALAVLVALGMTCSAVAADVSGTWKLAAPQPPAGGGGGGGGGFGGGTFERTLVLKQDGSTLTGKYVQKFGDNPPTEATVENGKITGDQIEFTVKQAGRGGGDPVVVTWKAKVTGDKMEGTSEREGSTRGPTPFTADKQK
jgi:hypothetical protein